MAINLLLKFPGYGTAIQILLMKMDSIFETGFDKKSFFCFLISTIIITLKINLWH